RIAVVAVEWIAAAAAGVAPLVDGARGVVGAVGVGRAAARRPLMRAAGLRVAIVARTAVAVVAVERRSWLAGAVLAGVDPVTDVAVVARRVVPHRRVAAADAQITRIVRGH